VNAGQHLRRDIRGNHHLLSGLVEGVEEMEELFLRALLVREELDVVDDEHIDGAIALAEGEDPFVPDGGDDLVDEVLARNIGERELWIPLEKIVTDGLEQMGLAEADAAVDEERVVGLGGDFGDRLRGRVGHLIRGTDHEGLEGVLRVQGRGLDHRKGFNAAEVLHVALEPDGGVAEACEHLRNETRVILQEPVAKGRAGHADAQHRPIERAKGGGPEPGDEGVGADAALLLH
jgi:hypothetical protein